MNAVYNLLTEFVPAPGVMVTESVGRCWRALEKSRTFKRYSPEITRSIF